MLLLIQQTIYFDYKLLLDLKKLKYIIHENNETNKSSLEYDIVIYLNGEEELSPKKKIRLSNNSKQTNNYILYQFKIMRIPVLVVEYS